MLYLLVSLHRLKKIDYLLVQLLGHNTVEWKVQRFLVYFCPHTCTVSPIINTPHQRGTFVTTDEPTSIHHYYPKCPQFTLGFTLGVACSACLDRWIMTGIHQYSTIKGSFTALKTFCAQPVHPCFFPNLATTDLLYYLHNFDFPIMPYN